MAISRKTLRSLIILLGGIAAVLLCAICVVAASRGHSPVEDANSQTNAAPIQAAKADVDRANAEKEAAEARKKIEARVDSLEDENGELKEKMKTSAGSLAEQIKKREAAEKEAAELRKELEAAQKDTAELTKKCEDAQAQLSELLAKQIKDPVPAAGHGDAAKPKVAHAGSGKVRRHNGYYGRDLSPDAPSSSRKHDPGVGPRLSGSDGGPSEGTDAP